MIGLGLSIPEVAVRGSISWLPIAGGLAPTLFADFATEGLTNHYWYNGTAYSSFAAWNAAIGGTFTRAASATYLQGGIVKTALSNVPRFPTDIIGNPTGLRLTGAGTNILLQSQNLVIGPWNHGTNISIAGGVSDPMGGTNAQTITATGSGAFNVQNYVFQAPSVSAGTYTSSLWMRRRTGTGTISFILPNATENIVTLTAAWQRFSTTGGPTGGLQAALQVDVLTSGDQIDVFQAQITASAFALDDIPTTTGTVTQAADSFSFPFANTTFSALAYTQNQQPSLNSAVFGTDADAPMFLFGSSPTFATFQPVNSTLQSPLISGSLAALHKGMVAGNTSSRIITADGATPNSAANPLLSATPTTMYIGSFNAGGADLMYGDLGRIAVWKSLVASSADLQRLTT